MSGFVIRGDTWVKAGIATTDEEFKARVATDPRVPHDLLAAIGEPCPTCGHKIMDHAVGFGGPGIHCHTQSSDGIMCECTSLGE